MRKTRLLLIFPTMMTNKADVVLFLLDSPKAYATLFFVFRERHFLVAQLPHLNRQIDCEVVRFKDTQFALRCKARIAKQKIH
jgi:hypothetical protein